MAFSANFFDAYNTEKTNIRKRRKENAEMFEAYKDAKVADGEEVSVEELSNMRSNLAGGDFYFGQALPAEKMMQGLADRTNERVTNTISSQFAAKADESQKISKVVDGIVPSLLSIPDADGTEGQEKIKARFTAINPADPDFGNQLYESWKERLPNMIGIAKDKEVNDFMAKNSTANLFSEVEHLTVGLPAWKINSIKQGYLSKEKVFANKNFSDALKNVNTNIKPEEFTRMDKTTFNDQFVKNYLLRNGVLAKDITDDMLAAAKAALEPSYTSERLRYSDVQETAFEGDVQKDAALLLLIGNPSLDNQQLMLDTVNRYRRDNELVEYTGINDPLFVRLRASFGTSALAVADKQYKDGKKTADTTATTLFKAAIEQTKTAFAAQFTALKDTPENNTAKSIAEQIHNSYHIPPNRIPKLLSGIIDAVKREAPSNPEEAGAMIGMLVRQYGLSTRETALLDYQRRQYKSDGIGIRPNTTVSEYWAIEQKPYLVNLDRAVATILTMPQNTGQNSVGVTAIDLKKKSLDLIDKFHDKLIKQIEIQKFTLDGDDNVLNIKKEIEQSRTEAKIEINNAQPNGTPTYFVRSGSNYITSSTLPPGTPANIKPNSRYVLTNGNFVLAGNAPSTTPNTSRTRTNSQGVRQRFVTGGSFGRGGWVNIP